MSESQTFGFAKLVPGFDFLQNLAKGAGGGLAQMPQLSKWVAPTLDVEELDKRIQELKAVHFWLEQNGKALAATIQAMEVQKMTLSTLQGMNLSMGDLAESLKLKPEMMASAFAAATDAGAAGAAKAPKSAKAGKTGRTGKATPADPSATADAAAQVDPLQWWGSLSQQFQEIAATALKDVAEAGASVASAAGAPTGKSARTATQGRKTAKPASNPAKSAARKRATAAPKRRAAAG